VHEVFKVDNLYGPPGTTSVYTRDRNGLRGRYAGVAAIELLTVGGSTTDQLYIDDARTWQESLRAALEARGKRVTVVNAGVDGHTTYGHLKSFELWLSKLNGLKPKYIVFYVGINDLFSPRGVHYDQLSTENRPIADRLADNSVLYHAFSALAGTWRASYAYHLAHNKVDFTQVHWTDTPLHRDHEARFADKLDELAARERLLGERAAALGAKSIWVTQPLRFYEILDGRLVGDAAPVQVDGVFCNGVDLARIMSLINARTMKTCAERGDVCIDLASELAFDDGDFYDYAHNTPSGAAKIGEYLAAKIAPLY
jgi:lysophospholipase L1-like esterase